MADDSFGDPSRSKKYHEGWLYHKDPNGKDWNKYWVVLRGNVLFIFASQKTNARNAHVGTLTLDPSAEVRTLPPEGKKKGYKFDLYTTAPGNTRKCNKFKFDKENERDVWKSYIIGLSTGIVPRDVHVLPGQLKDIVEAIGDFQNTPPPLPTLPRPRMILSTKRHPSQSGSQRSYGSNGSDSDGSGSFGSHITTQKKRAQRRSSEPDIEAEDSLVSNLRQLYRRQSELAVKPLATNRSQPPRSPSPPQYNYQQSDQQSDASDEAPSIVWTEFSLGKPPEKGPPRNRQQASESDDMPWGAPPIGNKRPSSPLPPVPPDRPVSPGVPPSLSPQFFTPPPGMRRPQSPPPAPLSPKVETRIRQPDFRLDHGGGQEYGGRQDYGGRPEYGGRTEPRPDYGGRPDVRDHRKSIPAPPSGTPRQSPASNNGNRPIESAFTAPSFVHQFHVDGRRNKEHPPWFFENTSREIAESTLTLGKRFGNVLMRESVTFKNTGSYVISMRREVAGGTQLNHYEVAKTGHGFKINVDNDHRPMRCLSEVMEFFIRQAGPGSTPMRTNDLRLIGLPGATSPTRRNYKDDDSGFDDPDRGYDIDEDHQSTPPRGHIPSPPATSNRGPSYHRHQIPVDVHPRPRGKVHMNVSGSVANEIQEAAMEIEYDIKKKTPQWDQSRLSIPPVPPPPPPGAALGSMDTYGGGAVYDARARGAGPPPEGGFSDPSLNRTVPPRMTPTETLQRSASHSDNLESSFDRMYNSSSGGPPSKGGRRMSEDTDGYGTADYGFGTGGSGAEFFAPPPPPIGGPPAPPPPAPPGGFSTARPDFGRSDSGDYGPTSPTFMTSPGPAPAGRSAGPPKPGGFGGMISFEDELKKRLVAQREDIYASGATILKSGNWN